MDSINLPEVSPIVKPLTHIMFHIEDTCFDQVSDQVTHLTDKYQIFEKRRVYN